jgi:hypothetical protein
MAHRLPIPVLACVAAGGFFLLALGRAALPAFQQPRVTLSPPQIDVGPVPVGQSVTRTFLVNNSGSSRLIIRDVKSSCECSLARLARRDVPPGASVPVDVIFKPSGPGPRRTRIGRML